MRLSDKTKIFELYKMYSATDYNFEAVFNSQIFLSNPRNYNDRFDSFVQILWDEFKDAYIEKHNIVLEDEFNRATINAKLDHYKNIVTTQDCSSVVPEYIPSTREQTLQQIRECYISYCEEISKLVNEYYICCFTTNKPTNNMVMWSHYANDCKGFCVKFGFSKLKYDLHSNRINAYQKFLYNHIWKVKYDTEVHVKMNCAKMLEIGIENLRNNPFIKGIVRKALVYKDKQWQHENEYRLILHKNDLDKIINTYKNCVLFRNNGCLINFNYASRLYIALPNEKLSFTTKKSIRCIADRLNIHTEYLVVSAENMQFVCDNVQTFRENIQLTLKNIPKSDGSEDIPF